MLLDNLSRFKIILASNSPRRRELLAGLGIEYEVKVIPGIDETYPETLKQGDIPMFISRKKAGAYNVKDNELIITADTIVWVDSEVLGKPKDTEDAARMLRLLSGRIHQVYTGVTLTTAEWQRSFVVSSDVEFAELNDEEINYYIEHYKPFDKAGAYGIQEWIGYIGVKSISGSYFNVMGLPVQRLYSELKKI
jgi:septum formation protein